MFFLSWGRWSKMVHLGSAGYRHCDRCDKDSEFQAFVNYTVRHIYWLFRWVTGREPHIACGNCGAVFWGDEVVDEATAKKAIPFFDRRGWMMGAGAIASLFGLGAVASAQDAQNNAAFIDAPAAGDMYEVDMARMSSKPEAPVMYSIIRVTEVEKDALKVQLAARYYEDLRGVERDVSNGAAKVPGYYTQEQVLLPRAAVAKMYKDGVINDVVR